MNASANLYGGPATTLALAATSAHPERAGVQEALLQVLLGQARWSAEHSGDAAKYAAVIALLAEAGG